jgi:hypothetical protein
MNQNVFVPVVSTRTRKFLISVSGSSYGSERGSKASTKRFVSFAGTELLQVHRKSTASPPRIYAAGQK